MRLNELLARRLAFDQGIGLQDTCMLSSMGRSGSTLASNIINCNNTYRVLFEPFRFDTVAQARDFIYPLCLHPEQDDPRYVLPARQIMSGKIHSKWIDGKNTAIFPKRRLIKDIRTNLFLGWLQRQFPEVKMILLLRHPCAVIDSWLAMRWGEGDTARQRLLDNRAFTEAVDGRWLEEYARVETPLEKLVFFWCFFNWMPLRQFNPNNLHILFYENLIVDSEDEIAALFAYLGENSPVQDALPALARPSRTTRKDSDFYRQGGIQIDGWKRKYTPEQVERAYQIMSLFGMDQIYPPETSLPNLDAARALHSGS